MTKDRQLLWIAFGPIGEALMMAVTMQQLKALDPTISMSVGAVQKEGMVKDILRTQPDIKVSRAYPLFSALRFLRTAKKSESYLFIQPTFGTHRLRIKLFAWMAQHFFGIRTIGFFDAGSWQPYTYAIHFDADVLYYENVIKALRAAGFKTLTPQMPKLQISSEPVAVAPRKPYIFIQAFAANPRRSFSPERWHKIAHGIHERYPGFQLVFSTTAENQDAMELIARGVPHSSFIDLSIPQIVGLLEGTALFIGPDTGITHLASMLKIPSVVVGNRSNPTWLPTYSATTRILTNEQRCTCTGRKGGNCTILEDGKPYFACMYDITDDQLYSSIAEVLATGRTKE